MTPTESYLRHFSQLVENQTTAYYLRCKSTPAEFDPASSLEGLLEAHRQIQENWQPADEYRVVAPPQRSFLALKSLIAQKMLITCQFCHHQCQVDRTRGETGYCGQTADTAVASAFLHWGEEPPLVPSGTVFFEGCTFDCQFCQNYDISTVGKSESKFTHNGGVDGRNLAKIARNLVAQGANNINWVGGDPTPHIHTILQALEYLDDNVCQLWNSNFYLSPTALDLLLAVIDLWLPDFKYGPGACAHKYSRIHDYWAVTTQNLRKIYAVGSKSIIIRHLVMPGHTECCSKPILEWIAHNTPNVLVNIMGQYRPAYRISPSAYPELNRRVTAAEMYEVRRFADQLGIEYRPVS